MTSAIWPAFSVSFALVRHGARSRVGQAAAHARKTRTLLSLKKKKQKDVQSSAAAHELPDVHVSRSCKEVKVFLLLFFQKKKKFFLSACATPQ
jgi:hypothetical protein